MSYIIFADYKKSIQVDAINQVIGNDLGILSGVELLAQQEAVSYLIQKYIVAAEFTDTNVWGIATTYNGSDRIYLDAPAYSTTSNYSVDDLALQGGIVYKCVSTTTGTFAPGSWQAIGPQYKLFFVTLPAPFFELTGNYKVGDTVFYNNKVYTAVLPSTAPGLYTALTGDPYSHNNYINPYPDTPVQGPAAWGSGVLYTVAAGTLPTDTTKWTAGDNRSAQLLQCCIDIALYHVHSRIAPRNVPDLRVKRYDEAIKWLKMAGRGDVTANLPLIQPKSGGRVRWGGSTKQINNY